LKICLINQHTYNHGDEAAKKALVRKLRAYAPGAEIKIIYNALEDKSDAAIEQLTHWIDGDIQDVYFKKRWGFLEKMIVMLTLFLPRVIGMPIILVSKLRDEILAMRWADVVISAPGGVNIGPYQDWKYLWSIRMALAMHKPVSIYSVSIGSSGNVLFDLMASSVLRKVNFLSLRDVRSQQYAATKSVKHVNSIDTAFLDVGVSKEMNEAERDNKKYAVFVPHDLSAWHPLYKKIDAARLFGSYKSILEVLLSRYDGVKLLPQVFGQNSDQYYFERLRDAVNDSHRVEVISQYVGSDAQQGIIKQASLVVGARYHSIVFAINQAVPFVCLSYEHKMTGMLELLGLSDFDVPVSSLLGCSDESQVTSVVVQCIDEASSAIKRIEKARIMAKETAYRTFEEVAHEFRP